MLCTFATALRRHSAVNTLLKAVLQRHFSTNCRNYHCFRYHKPEYILNLPTLGSWHVSVSGHLNSNIFMLRRVCCGYGFRVQRRLTLTESRSRY